MTPAGLPSICSGMTCRALLLSTLVLVGCGDEPTPTRAAPSESASNEFARQHEAWVSELARPESVHVASLSSRELDEALARFARALPDDAEAIRGYSLRAYRLGAGETEVQLRLLARAELPDAADGKVDIEPLTDSAAALVDGDRHLATRRALAEAVTRVRHDHPSLHALAVRVHAGAALVHRGVALVDFEAREVLWLRAHER